MCKYIIRRITVPLLQRVKDEGFRIEGTSEESLYTLLMVPQHPFSSGDPLTSAPG